MKNKSLFYQWKEGKFESVDEKNLDKNLLQSIKKWNPSTKVKEVIC